MGSWDGLRALRSSSCKSRLPLKLCLRLQTIRNGEPVSERLLKLEGDWPVDGMDVLAVEDATGGLR